MARVVLGGALLGLECVGAGISKILGDGPGEGATSGSANFTNSVEVGGDTTAEDEGGWGLVLGGVGDGVGLACLDTAGRIGVDGQGHGGRDKGSARDDDLEETHINGSGGVVVVIRW